METREDLKSLLPFLPLVVRSSSLFWPSRVVEALKALSEGPDINNVNSGESLFAAISDIRNSLSLCAEPLAPSAPEGYSLFFDELMSRAESTKWFGEVLPALANLLLRMPSLLQSHYENADKFFNGVTNGVRTSLRLLGPQVAGIVFLSQELIAAFLACAFFCLFPVTDRGAKHLPTIDLDHLFEDLYENYSEKQENKIMCILHYFERICSCTPGGFVSFERKVLPWEQFPTGISYPGADFWNKSVAPLCSFEVHNLGFIEDQSNGALEVDFANKYLGGGALHRGCVQEEIRFMINPELIAGMLFLPRMEDNEAIEIVGAERFSNYRGYASSFRFSGDHVDRRNVDSFGRRNTRIVAIDALNNPGMRQYKLNYLLREINKAFCGFSDLPKCNHYKSFFRNSGPQGAQSEEGDEDANVIPMNKYLVRGSDIIEDSDETCSWCQDHKHKNGIATGNWGCGAFGGDTEIKAIIQWLAASQALRPAIFYYTFGVEVLRNLDKVSQWIVSHEWTVGDLWNMLVEYSSQRLNGETNVGFFKWLLPSLC
ncbi:poly(ADP-ribose) glycohydrolase 1 isoform X1 [Manihot esculenta]|uniref:poly(ADP-ribose) glycohydrolase n=1 Tax=Manihot esculenta TaxID=3983 RepID=A0A2C9VY61_MANES|nr:poly(ADP-ribose) glycohydrolase 1 isoform X1 [Manihot esculenta]OAY51350.1 hypothetical protein MANES_05G207700v8 [Manihot esculenta]